MIGIGYNRASFREELNRKLAQANNPSGMLMAIGRELANQLRTHFRTKDQSEPNHLSARREHFWLQVMRSTHPPEQTGYNQVSVWVSDPRFAQKVFGGRIQAKRAGALTIPVEEQAYGRTAATFEKETGLKLFLVKTGKGDFQNAVLAIAGPGKTLQVEYILAKSVTQDKDPTALPERKQLERQLLERGQKYLDHEKGNA